MKCYHGILFSCCSSGPHTECLDGYESVDFEGELSVFLSLPPLPQPSVTSSAFSIKSHNPQLFTFCLTDPASQEADSLYDEFDDENLCTCKQLHSYEI